MNEIEMQKIWERIAKSLEEIAYSLSMIRSK